MKIIKGIWKIKPSEVDKFIALCKWIEPFSSAEPGHISYTFAENKLSENTFFFLKNGKTKMQ
jgi:quinol monooxygenase YgiN